MPSSPDARICIVGAGSSGLVAAKVAKERGLPFDAFEMASDVGGLWRYGSDAGRSPAYASLHTSTSPDRTAYRCHRMQVAVEVHFEGVTAARAAGAAAEV